MVHLWHSVNVSQLIRVCNFEKLQYRHVLITLMPIDVCKFLKKEIKIPNNVEYSALLFVFQIINPTNSGIKRLSVFSTWVWCKWNMAAVGKSAIGSSAMCMWGMVFIALPHARSLSLCPFLLSLWVSCLSLSVSYLHILVKKHGVTCCYILS